MKLKGIHPAEQHFDKVLVGVLGVTTLGIVAYQFLIPVNNVKVGTGPAIPPDQAFVPVEREAATLAQRLESREPNLPDQAPPGLGDSLTAVLNPVTINPGTGLPLGPQLALGGISASSGVIANASYGAPVPPAPVNIVTSSFRSAIDPQEIVRTPGLAAFVPAQQPFDKAAVSIEALFNGEELASLLQADPDGDGPMQAMPLSWWRDPQVQGRYLIDIVGIEVERETLRTPEGITPPGETTQLVETLPGRFNGRAYWNERVRSLGDVSMELAALEGRAEEIRRPAYYASIAGFPWEPPSEVVPPEDRGDRAREVERARRQLTDLDNRLTRMRDQLGNAGNRPPREDPRGARPGSGRTPGSGASPGGRPGGRTPPAPRDDNAQPAANPEVLERQIERLEGERAKVVERLRGLGESVDGDTGVPAGTQQVAPTIATLEDDEIRVWAHDIRVEPGAEYRYRVRVVMNNPLFGRGLKEEQASLSEQKFIESEWSQWSEPVEVDRDRYFFVTSAEDRSQVSGRPRASAELIVFYYGYYRSASVGLEPGDAITATVRLPANLKLADMEKLRELFAEEPPAADPNAPPPAPTPGSTPAGRTPGGPSMNPGTMPAPRDPRDTTDPRDPRNPGGAGPAPVAEAPPAAEWMTIDAEDRVELSEDAILLDVGRVAAATAPVVGGGPSQRFKAILRRASGALDVRIPEEDRASALYKRLNSSVRAGIAATAPAPAPLPERPANQPPAPRAPEPPRRTPGGGGGGGGGSGG